MLEGFEDITYELTKEEQALVSEFVRSFESGHHGPDQAITNKQINEAYKAKGRMVGEARVRKIMNYIRVNALVPRLIATSKGYYVAESKEQLTNYIKSLNQRIREIQRVERAMGKQLMQWNVSSSS